MIKKMTSKRSITLLAALMMALLISGCGGGGGGGGTPATPSTGGTNNNNNNNNNNAGRTITISGTMSSASAGRVAGRVSEAAVASTHIIAYRLTDGSHTAMNSTSDATDATGNFNITVNIGDESAANIIIEALPNGATAGATANPRVALENVAANLTGVTADDTTATEGLLWISSPGDSLTNIIKPVVAYFAAESIDARTGIDSSATAAALVSAMKTIHTACGSQTGNAKKSCVIGQIDTLKASITSAAVTDIITDLETDYKVDTGVATIQETLKFLDPRQSDATVNTVVAIANDADVSLSNISTQAEAVEMFDKLANAIAAHDASYATTLAKKLAIKNALLPVQYGDTFTNGDVENLIINLKSAYSGMVGQDAAALSGLVSSNDMISIVSGLDVIEGMLTEVFVEDGQVTRDQAWAMVQAFVYCLSQLGSSSENNTSMQAILDDWVVSYDDATFRDKLHTVFDPLGMNDRNKTKDLMRLSHDLGDTNGTHDAVEAKLNVYLTPATVVKAMALYDKYYGKMDCSFNVTSRMITGSNCITQAEIVDLLETHFEKPLPILNAVLTGIQQWVQSSANDTKIIAIGTAYTALNDRVYPAFKANKAALGPVMDAAGINKELFWLVINLSPYIQ